MWGSKKVVVSGIAGLALLGTVVGSVAAAPPTPTPAGPPAQQQQWRGQGPATGAGFGYQDFAGVNSAAKVLGMTAEQIQAERLAGKSLGQIADSKGVKRDALVSAMVESRKTVLDASVKAGTLTQEQANSALETMRHRMTQSLDRTEIGPNRPADGSGLGLALGRGAGRQMGPQDGTGFGPMGRGMGQGPRR